MKHSKRLIGLCLVVFLLFLPNLARQNTDFSEFTEKEESEHFIFWYCEGDGVDIKRQECFYGYIVKLFQIKPERGEKITYLKFKNSTQLEQKSNKSAGALAYKSAKVIWSTKTWENHELIHILQFNYLNWSTDFFNEGLAMAFQIDPLKKDYTPDSRFAEGRTPLNQYLKIKIKGKKYYIPLEKIITTEDFRAFLGDHKIIAYLEAGSFVRYLIDKYGLKKFFQFLKITDEDSRASTIKENLIKIYKLPLEILEKQWLIYLEDWSENKTSLH